VQKAEQSKFLFFVESLVFQNLPNGTANANITARAAPAALPPST
jgi:hypothetical protein